jgi:SAM-dependent methyltransferase
MMSMARISAIMNESFFECPEKRFYNAVYDKDHPANYGENNCDPDWQKRISELIDKTRLWLTAAGLDKKPSVSVLEIGCGLAYLKDIHPGWHGVEYSRSAVVRLKARDGAATRIFECDVQQLPFQDGCFEGIYSWAVLEHVLNPNKGLLEIDRVLRWEDIF